MDSQLHNYILDLVNRIRAEFGLRALEVVASEGFSNAARYSGRDQCMSYDDAVIYDPAFLMDMAAEFGKDVIVGIIGHEVGHSLILPHVNSHDHELSADIIAGLTMARLGCAQGSMEKFYISPQIRQESQSHPHGYFRLQKFREGFTLASNNLNTSLKELLKQTSGAETFNKIDLIFDVFQFKNG